MAFKNFKMSGFFTNTNIVNNAQIGLFDGRQTTATLGKEVESKEVLGTIDGSDITQVLDTISTKVTYKFSVEVNALDSDTLALMFGETWASVASFDDKVISRGTVPSSAPYEIANADIATTPVASDVQISINDNGAWGFKRPLQVITTGTPTGDQVLVTGATDKKFTFPAALAGAPVKIAVKKTRLNIDSLGVIASPTALDDLKFIGHVGSTRKEEIILVLDLSPSGGWELPIGDEAKVKLEFKPVAKGSNRSAVQAYRIAA